MLFKSILVLMMVLAVCTAAETTSSSRASNTGKYVPTDEGRYIPNGDSKYVHVDDQRDLGRYHHIPFPYDGGYGPYSGQNIPYVHDLNGQPSNINYQTANPPFTYDPSKNNGYSIDDLCHLYGFVKIRYPQQSDSKTSREGPLLNSLNNNH